MDTVTGLVLWGSLSGMAVGVLAGIVFGVILTTWVGSPQAAFSGRRLLGQLCFFLLLMVLGIVLAFVGIGEQDGIAVAMAFILPTFVLGQILWTLHCQHRFAGPPQPSSMLY